MLYQLTPFIIRCILVSQDALNLEIGDFTYLGQTANIVVSCANC